jgi:hypothetical protein
VGAETEKAGLKGRPDGGKGAGGGDLSKPKSSKEEEEEREVTPPPLSLPHETLPSFSDILSR